MCKAELTDFFAELTELAAELSEFSLPKQCSRNSIPPVSYFRRRTQALNLERLRMKKSSFQYGIKFSIENGFSSRAPLWPQKTRLGIEIPNRE